LQQIIIHDYFVLVKSEKRVIRYNGKKSKGMTFLNSLVAQINFFGANLRTCDMMKA
jgi:hypothetical protein